MNALTPVVDRYMKPRIYGRDRRGTPLEIESWFRDQEHRRSCRHEPREATGVSAVGVLPNPSSYSERRGLTRRKRVLIPSVTIALLAFHEELDTVSIGLIACLERGDDLSNINPEHAGKFSEGRQARVPWFFLEARNVGLLHIHLLRASSDCDRPAASRKAESGRKPGLRWAATLARRCRPFTIAAAHRGLFLMRAMRSVAEIPLFGEP